MRRLILGGLTAVAAAGPASAQQAIAPPAPPALVDPVPGAPASGYIAMPGVAVRQKAFNSQLAVAGKVSMGKETLDVAQYPGQTVKQPHKLAVVQVDKVLIGDKPDGAVKVLIPPADPAQVPFEQPGRRVPYYRPPVGQVQLIDGQEGVFFLSKHPTADGYHQIQYGHTPLNPQDTNYKDDLAAVVKIGAVLADPLAALKAKDPKDRFEAAAALVYKYRRHPQTNSGRPPEQQAIPAEESKLILKAIAEADWAQYDKPRLGSDPQPDYTLMPNSLLSNLGVFPGQHGMPQFRVNPGQGYNAAYHEHFKTWLDGDGTKFEIKRFVTKK